MLSDLSFPSLASTGSAKVVSPANADAARDLLTQAGFICSVRKLLRDFGIGEQVVAVYVQTGDPRISWVSTASGLRPANLDYRMNDKPGFDFTLFFPVPPKADDCSVSVLLGHCDRVDIELVDRGEWDPYEISDSLSEAIDSQMSTICHQLVEMAGQN